MDENTDALVTSPEGRSRRRGAVVGLVGVVAVILAWDVLGTAGAAVLGGAWLLAAAVGRAAPRLAGPASWAAGVIGAFGIIVGASVALALVSPARQPALVNAVVLALPLVVGAALLLWALRRPRAGAEPPIPTRWPLALVVTIGGLAGFALLARLGQHYDVAWAMGGDARNHAMLTRLVLADGGLTIGQLRASPIGANAFVAVLQGAAGRDVVPGELLLEDARALAATYVLAAIAMATLLAGAVLEALPRAVREGRLRTPVALVALGAGLGAISPLVLGTALADGFMSAYVVVVLVLGAFVTGLRIVADRGASTYGVPVIILATGLTVATWPVVVVMPATVLAWVLVTTFRARDRSQRSRAELAVLVTGAVSLVGIAGALVLSWPSLRDVFMLPGSIAAPAGWLLPVLLLVGLAVALGSARDEPFTHRAMALPLAATAVGAATVIGLRLLAEGPGLSWSYYALKTSWLVACSVIWVPLVPLAAWAAAQAPDGATADEGVERGGRPAARERLGVAAAAVAGALGIWLGIGNATAAPEPVLAAARGWGAPSAEIVEDVIEAADEDEPFVFWDWNGVGDDRLANFWAALAWSTNESGEWVTTPGAERSFPVWAYFADGTTTSTLCELVLAEPDITVYTRDDDLDLDLEASCPDAAPEIVVGD